MPSCPVSPLALRHPLLQTGTLRWTCRPRHGHTAWDRPARWAAQHKRLGVQFCALLPACLPLEPHLQKRHGHAALLRSPLPYPAPPHCHLPCLQVLVLRLKTVGTVEERVVGVASDKAQLADRSITGGCCAAGSCCRSDAE